MDISLFVDNVLDAERWIPDEDFDKREAPLSMPAPGFAAYTVLTARL